MTKEESKDWTYEVKCRRCSKISEMWFSSQKQTTAKDFIAWANEHSTFPKPMQCDCHKGMMIFHDIVSYGNILDLTIQLKSND